MPGVERFALSQVKIVMRVGLLKRAAILLTILSALAAGYALTDPRPAAGAGASREGIVVEVSVEGFMELARRELPFEAGANGGGGGGVSPPRGIESWRYGLSLISARKREAVVRLELTLIYADGTEKKIDEQFLVARGKANEHRFAHGVRVKSYFWKIRPV